MDTLDWIERVEKFYEEMNLAAINNTFLSIDRSSLDQETLIRLEALEKNIKKFSEIVLQNT